MKNILNSEMIPARQTLGSAGYDIYATEDMCIERWFKTFDTGVCFTGEECPVFDFNIELEDKLHDCFPQEWVALILPRSSYGFKYGLKFANTVCVIDKDYRDTIKLSIAGDRSFTIKKGDRFAQMIFIPHCTLLCEERPVKLRGGGIGSTN